MTIVILLVAGSGYRLRAQVFDKDTLKNLYHPIHKLGNFSMDAKLFFVMKEDSKIHGTGNHDSP